MWIVKFSGLVLIMAASSFLGAYKAFFLKKRVELLGGLCEGLARLKEQIRLGGGELREILPISLKDCSCLTVSDSHVEVSAAGLCGEDILIIENLFSRLGSADGAAECSRIERSLDLLHRQLDGARLEYSQKGRLWRCAGVCAGAVICIFLI